MIAYLHESNHEREGPSVQQKQTSTTELTTPTSFAVERPLEGWAVLSCAIWRKRGVAPPFIWKSGHNMTYFHSLHKLIMFSSLLKSRKGGQSKLI